MPTDGILAFIERLFFNLSVCDAGRASVYSLDGKGYGAC
jgi:hypothetical protein